MLLRCSLACPVGALCNCMYVTIHVYQGFMQDENVACCDLGNVSLERAVGCFGTSQLEHANPFPMPHVEPALDISTGPARFQTAGPVRASTFYFSLTRTGHIDTCRAIRFKIVLARTMTNHSMYFSRGRPPHILAIFAQSFCYSETPAWRVRHVNQAY